MLRRLGNIVILFFEGVFLLGVCAAGLAIALPMFQIQQTLKGNPLWFLPGHDKSAR